MSASIPTNDHLLPHEMMHVPLPVADPIPNPLAMMVPQHQHHQQQHPEQEQQNPQHQLLAQVHGLAQEELPPQPLQRQKPLIDYPFPPGDVNLEEHPATAIQKRWIIQQMEQTKETN